MPITTARLAVTAALSALLAGSLRVAPDSPCSKFCGNSLSSTAVDEMACDAGTLEGTTVGLVWEKCTQCLLTSDHVSGNQTDLQWLLCRHPLFRSAVHGLVLADVLTRRQPEV